MWFAETAQLQAWQKPTRLMSPKPHDLSFFSSPDHHHHHHPACLSFPKQVQLWVRTPTSLISSVEGQTQEGSDGGRKTKAAGQRRPCRWLKNESYVRGEGGERGTGLVVEPPWPQLPSAWLQPPPSNPPNIRHCGGSSSSCNSAKI